MLNLKYLCKTATSSGHFQSNAPLLIGRDGRIRLNLVKLSPFTLWPSVQNMRDESLKYSKPNVNHR